MKTTQTVLLGIVGIFVGTFVACEADLPGDRTGDVAGGAAPLSASGPDRYRVVGIRQLTPHGGRVDWSPDGKLIVFDARIDGFWRLRTMKPDGSDDQALECSNVSLPARRHVGQPAWHPSGDWIVLQVEKSNHRNDFLSHSSPGAGFYHDLWVMKMSTRQCFQLTDVRDGLDDANPNPGGSLHPVFSRAGDQLLWTDLEDGIGADTTFVGDWRLAIASVTLGEAPSLGPIRTYQPGASGLWYESHGWGPGDASVYFSGNTMGQGVLDSDINLMPIAAPDSFTRLTKTSGKGWERGIYDEHAHFTRADDAFVWMSNKTGRDELWIASLDGSLPPRQLTHFNESESPQSGLVCGKRSNPSDSAWNPVPPPGHEQLVVHLGVDFHIPNPTYEQIFLVDFITDGTGDGEIDLGPPPVCPPPP